MRKQTKSWKDIQTDELYAILRLRSEVFVVEQNCVYQDMDEKDQKSWHVLFWDGHKLAAYCRILPSGVSYDEVSIGRVIVEANYRNQGLGIELTQYSIHQVEQIFGNQSIRISAQSHLENFYSKFGFQPTGKHYLEDGIPHKEMVRTRE